MGTEWSSSKYYPREGGIPGLRLATSLGRKGVINEIFQFFETGQLNIPRGFDGPLPRFVKPSIIIIKEGLGFLYLATFERSEHPLLPFIKEAFATFDGLVHEPEVVPPVREVRKRGERSGGSMAYTFTSYLSAPENLVNFALDYLSPQPDTKPAPGTKGFDEIVIEWRRERKLNTPPH